MQFQTRLAALLPLLATFAVAAPFPNVEAGINPVLKRADLPEGCSFANNDPASRAIDCVAPDAHTYPTITSNLPNSCTADPNNPYSVSCKLPGPPTGTDPLISKRTATDAAYAFNLVCDKTGCHETSGRKREAADASAVEPAYTLHISWKRALENVAKRAEAAAVEPAYTLHISWKRAFGSVAKRAEAAVVEPAYTLHISW